jgi:hypothetical protein
MIDAVFMGGLYVLAHSTHLIVLGTVAVLRRWLNAFLTPASCRWFYHVDPVGAGSAGLVAVLRYYSLSVVYLQSSVLIESRRYAPNCKRRGTCRPGGNSQPTTLFSGKGWEGSGKNEESSWVC